MNRIVQVDNFQNMACCCDNWKEFTQELLKYFNKEIPNIFKKKRDIDIATALLEIIKDYELNNFGEITTDFSNSEQVVNMYVYIVGEEILEEILQEIK